MAILQSANVGLRFILELIALYSLGYWGFSLDKGTFVKVLFGIGTPLVAAVLWAMFGSPAASMRLSENGRLILEIVICGSAAIGLYASGHHTQAWIFGIVFVLNRVLMIVWGQ